MSTVVFRDGRRPFDPAKRRLDLGAHLTGTLPPVPAKADWLSRVTFWGMLLNDSLGDCVIAELLHEIEARTTYTGSPFTATNGEALALYEAITGYDPSQVQPDGSNPTDQGTNMADAMNYWRTAGVSGHTILAFASVDVTNLAEVQAAVAIFGAVALGVRFPKSAMDQFDAGQPWDVVPDDGGIEGGHAIQLGEYDTTTGMYEVVTWGAVQKVTEAWLRKYLDEAWVVITRDWLDSTGHDPVGLDLHGLGADFSQLTGQPDPFPAPTPQPTPAPTPVPPGPTPVPVPVPPVPPVDRDALLTAWATSRDGQKFLRRARGTKVDEEASQALGRWLAAGPDASYKWGSPEDAGTVHVHVHLDGAEILNAIQRRTYRMGR